MGALSAGAGRSGSPRHDARVGWQGDDQRTTSLDIVHEYTSHSPSRSCLVSWLRRWAPAITSATVLLCLAPTRAQRRKRSFFVRGARTGVFIGTPGCGRSHGATLARGAQGGPISVSRGAPLGPPLKREASDVPLRVRRALRGGRPQACEVGASGRAGAAYAANRPKRAPQIPSYLCRGARRATCAHVRRHSHTSLRVLAARCHGGPCAMAAIASPEILS